MFKLKPGRLFWKLLVALWISMILSVAGTVGLFFLIGQQPPPPGDSPFTGAIPILPLLACGVAILVTGLALAWYLSRPLQHLRWALSEIAQGHFHTRVRHLMRHRRDEIVDLAQDFDRMAARLQKLTDLRNILLHDISHELRSPLTRIQAAIGLLHQDPKQTDAMIARISRESERLDVLIEEVFTLHRMEGGAGPITRDRVNIIDLLHAIAEDADFEARASSRCVIIHAPETFVANVCGEAVCRAFENVIRNAVKFSPEGSTVEVCASLTYGGRALETIVRDRGPGVPSDMLEKIFQPFARVESVNSVRGTGLGLAIARRAIEMHEGCVDATPRQGGGLEVRIMLPLQ